MPRKKNSTIDAANITAAATKYGAKIALICAIIGASAVIIASMGGHDGIINSHSQINNSNNVSISNNQINIKQISGGSIYINNNSINHSKQAKLELQVGSVLDQYNMAHFSIVSSGNGRYVIDRLFIKIHGYERCRLRDELICFAAPDRLEAYSFYISPEYSQYDIIPIDYPGNIGTWIYEGDSNDNFFVNFYFEPYTLFNISIELEARDLNNNIKLNISSTRYNLIWVAHGNCYGCLDLSRWYDPSDIAKPKDASYMDKLTALQYQLLTMDMDGYNYYDYLNKLNQNQLITIMQQLNEISSKRKDNIVFQRNLQYISNYLNQTQLSGRPPATHSSRSL